VAHEVGHQWWGSRISNANNQNYWFVESLAEYFSAVFLEAVYGWKEYEEQVEEWRRYCLNADRKVSVQNASALWTGESGGYYTSVYAKGPYAFHMLRELFKDPTNPQRGPEGADKKFFDALKAMSLELADKREIVTLDIQNAAENAFGGVDEKGNKYKTDLSWFFNQWIRGVGTPQYALLYKVRPTEDGKWLVEGTIKQRVVIGSSRSPEVVEGQYYRGLLEIAIKTKSGDMPPQRALVEGAETPFKLKVAEKPIEVTLNQNGGMLAHEVLINKSW
jgi:aminopeptidase N